MKYLLLLLALFGSYGANAAERPNILILIGDDIDRDCLGPWGGEALTPHLDQLAKDGVRVDRAYANVAMCAPFRQEFFSGRSAWRTRAMPNHSRSVKGTKSLPHYLRPLGYRVGLIGKSHVGPREAYPFDKVGPLPMKEDANPQALKLARGYMTEARDAGQPFCLVVASHDGHGPYTHGDREAYKPEDMALPEDVVDTPEYRKELVAHYAEVTRLDALLGALRKTLSDLKLADNTLVLFSSEQGNAFPFAKWTCFEDGLASGIAAVLPGKIPAGSVNEHIFWISDIAPTLLEAAGGIVDAEMFDGRSQWGNFSGGDAARHDYAFGAFSNCNIIENHERVFPIRSVRDTRYSLIWSPRGKEETTSNLTLSMAKRWINGDRKGTANTAASWVRDAQSDREKTLIKRLHHRPVWALYDRENDPEELVNLAGKREHADVQARLEKALQQWLARWDDSDPVATERAFVRKKRE